MITLTPACQEALKRVVDAGPQGLPLDALTVSAAVNLGIYDLVNISAGDPQRVTATPKGRAFRMRGAFA